MTTEIIDLHDGRVVKIADINQGIVEANYYQELDHPNIIKPEKIEVENGRIKITMKKLLQLKEIEVDFDKILTNMIDALAYLEANGILNNDVKPENILFDPETEQYILIDFGIANRFHQCSSIPLGSVHTAPPEIFDSRIPQIRGSQSDIFRLGATLYILATGKYISEVKLLETPASDIETGFRNRNFSKIPEFQALDPKLRGWILEMTSEDPMYRPTALELATLLGTRRNYLKTQSLVPQMPNWSSEQINAVKKEMEIMQKSLFRQREDLKENSEKLFFTFAALTDSLKFLEIPIFIFASLATTWNYCAQENFPSIADLRDFLSQWRESLVYTDNIYDLFGINGNEVIPPRSLGDLDQKILRMVETLDYRTLF